MVSGEVSGKKLLPLGQALGCSLIDGGESVFAGFQQYSSALCAPCVYDIAIADIKLPEPLEYLYAFFVGRNRGRDGEIIRLPDLFQETGMPDQQDTGRSPPCRKAWMHPYPPSPSSTGSQGPSYGARTRLPSPHWSILDTR